VDGDADNEVVQHQPPAKRRKIHHMPVVVRNISEGFGAFKASVFPSALLANTSASSSLSAEQATEPVPSLLVSSPPYFIR
jgi:hypothetical protein